MMYSTGSRKRKLWRLLWRKKVVHAFDFCRATCSTFNLCALKKTDHIMSRRLIYALTRVLPVIFLLALLMYGILNMFIKPGSVAMVVSNDAKLSSTLSWQQLSEEEVRLVLNFRQEKTSQGHHQQQLQKQQPQEQKSQQQQQQQQSQPSAAAVQGLHPSVNVVPSFPPPNTSLNPRICLSLPRSPSPAIICVYDRKDDTWVSGAIQNGGLWESDLVMHMVSVLKANPALGLVDLGSNIGIYTLMAAALGRHVLAVDMLDQNILLLQNSLQLSNFSHLVTLVQNAIYKDRDLKLGIKVYSGNVGGTAVDESGQGATKTVQSTCLDDLIPLVKSKSVFMKMDIETAEHHAISCGQKFFSTIDVKMIQMEWSQKTTEATKIIIDFVTQFNYAPKRLVGGTLVPHTIEYKDFKGDVFFVKKDQ